MIRRSKRNHEIPALNTSSLPDLIFTVLFFFMIVTHMRNVTVKVRYQVPQGKELNRLAKKSSVMHIYIGKPIEKRGADNAQATIVQFNDKVIPLAELRKYVAAERSKHSPDEAKELTVSIKADKDTKMKTIAEVKQALREAKVYNVNLTATQNKSKR